MNIPFLRTIRSVEDLVEKLPRECENLLDVEHFRYELRKERLRSDRNGNHFSVAVFFFQAGADVARLHRSLALLSGEAQRRGRESDERGLLRQRDRIGIGLLLHGAGAKEARKLVVQVQEAYEKLAAEKDLMPVQSEVWPYMPEEPDSGNANGNGNGNGRVREKVQEEQGAESLLQYSLSVSLPRWKRAIDIAGSLAAITLFSPAMLGTALLIRCVSKGPVLFKQERVGHLGRPFVVYKFRTMHVNVDTAAHQEHLRQLIRNGKSKAAGAESEAMVKLENNPQIIPFGRILRATCVDELPQLFNTLRGDMSLVGPRPPIPYEVAEYSPWQRGRFDTVPGMTGLWQVSGKNRLSFQQMVRLDIKYARRHSFGMDLRILCATPMVVLQQLSDQWRAKMQTRKERITNGQQN